MFTIQIDNTYYSISDKICKWLEQNATATSWDQMFGTTTLIFTTKDQVKLFKKWLKEQ